MDVGFLKKSIPSLNDQNDSYKVCGRQRSPLTVVQIKVLEQLVKDVSRSAHDRVMAGYFLMLVHGRLRFSDGQRITGMKLEMIHVDDEPWIFRQLETKGTWVRHFFSKKKLLLARTELTGISSRQICFTPVCKAATRMRSRKNQNELYA